MQVASRAKIAELQTLISKMPIEDCCVSILPEMGVRWREVSRAVRNSRLPMQPASVARVLCRHAARTLTEDDVDDLLNVLRLKLVVSQDRKWHVVTLSEPTDEEMSLAQLVRALPGRVASQLRGARGGRTLRPEVEITMVDDLVYMSVQMVSSTKSGLVLYVATPPGEPVALVSTLASNLLKAVVLGLGFKSYEDAKLFGRDIRSLLRIHNRACTDNVEHLASVPQYAPAPVVSNTGIDYTNKAYDQAYVSNIIGPDPPLLTDLTISSTRPFFDPSRLDKDITLTLQLKSEDVAKTLKSWVDKNALAATSDFFHIFHKIKSNRIEYNNEQEE